MKIQNFILLAILSIGLVSCECYVAVKGRVVSSVTGNDLSNVKIKMRGRDIETVSDIDGKFLLDEQTSSCYDPEVELTKEGYKPFEMKITGSSGGFSYTVNNDNEFIDFDKPGESQKGTLRAKYSQKFKVKGDSIIFYLDEMDVETEIEK